LTKRKKYNSSAFTLIEILIVIVIIGIIVATLLFDYSPNKLQLATDQLIKDIRFAQSLALKEDKYQPFPINASSKEQNRSKYWFKQWWQLKFAKDGNDIIYMVFSDQPANGKTNNFDRKVITSSHKYELAKYADGRYVYGGKTYLYKYERANQDANLSKFGIKKVILVSQYGNKYNGSIRFLFDNFGNVFLSEGKRGDKNDINPFKNRNMLIKNAILYLCLNLTCDKNRSIVITPSGELITDLTQYISF
jgi:prepilin-type N-terminal cleavage/methylation domain-containing protein